MKTEVLMIIVLVVLAVIAYYFHKRIKVQEETLVTLTQKYDLLFNPVAPPNDLEALYKLKPDDTISPQTSLFDLEPVHVEIATKDIEDIVEQELVNLKKTRRCKSD